MNLDYYNLINNSEFIKLNPNDVNELSHFDFNKIANTDIILYTETEVINENSKLDKILLFIEKLNNTYDKKKFYLYSSSINIKNEFVIPAPLYLTIWKNRVHHSDYSLIIDTERIKLNLENHKKNKSVILRWNTNNSPYRINVKDTVKINQIQNSIIKFDDHHFKTWSYVVDEYLMSKISVVGESVSGHDLKFGFLSEKTILSILTKTLPLIYGHNDLVAHLNSIDIFTLNNIFDKNLEYDSLDINDFNKTQKFTEWCNYLFDMSDSDIDELYKKNIETINSNYKLLMSEFNRI